MKDIRDYIKGKYSLALKTKSSCGCDNSAPVPLSGEKASSSRCCSSSAAQNSGEIPSFGCGFPVESAEIIPGSRILDLGSGAGGDLIRASRKTGPAGKVFGIDMTDSMLETARRNIESAGLDNVELLKGYIEEIPLENDRLDLIISNCVINLSPDKGKVLKEAYRVLRPGGRFIVADTVLLKPLPDKLKENLDAWSGCASGALSLKEYQELLEGAGFQDIHFDETHPLMLDAQSSQVLFSGVNQEELELLDRAIASSIIKASKPALEPMKEGTDYILRNARIEDIPTINQLLGDSMLPLTPKDINPDSFLLAEKDGTLSGMIGYLIKGHSALLRSLAVPWEYRNRGIGHTLIKKVIGKLSENQIHDVYLLTQTARKYMETKGFIEIKREEIPPSLLKDSGLDKACPSSSICMKYIPAQNQE